MAYRRLLIIPIVLLSGALSLWAVNWAVYWNAAREIKNLAQDALCVVELKEGRASASGSFTTSQSIEQFQVIVCPEANRERLSLFFDGGTSVQYRGTITRPQRFGVGRGIPPGTYTVTLRQVKGTHGGIVVIADSPTVSTGTTGWQIFSRTYLGLLVICGLWALINRRSSDQRQRMRSTLAFQYVFLGFLGMFSYLLAHEGGHALGEISFGRYDFWQSDFWGIHGSPHSGGTAGPGLEPWQQAIITGGAVIVPTLAAWALFLFWWLRLRHTRNRIVRLYVSAVIGFLILPHIVSVGCLLGVMSDGHVEAFITCIPGPQWLGKTVSWCVLLVCVLMLWQIVPETIKILKAQSIELQKLQRSHEPNETGPANRRR